MTRSKVRVLILTASYGSGHNEAANCLAAGFERAGAEAIVVDHFKALVNPIFERATRTFYFALLRRAPLVWAWRTGGRLLRANP